MRVSYPFKTANCVEITVGNVDFLFSYETCVGFHTNQTGKVVSENVWGPTTGKHINSWQPDKKLRLDRDDFERKLALIEEAMEI